MRFLLACEGRSDAGLISHIERLVIENCNDTTVEGEMWFYNSPLAERIRTGLQASANQVDVLFVHRDANSAGAEARFQEIAGAVEEARVTAPWVGVVPVRMTEAWLLLDEAAIRKVVGRPNGRVPLNLPTPREAERRATPKDILANALLAASEATGRRRKRIVRDFSRFRQRLLADLSIDGPVTQLASWRRFRDDTLTAIHGRIP